LHADTGEPAGDICRYCREHEAEWKLEELKQQNIRNAVTQMISAAKQNRVNCPDITALATTTVALFGGIEQLCKGLVDIVISDETKPREKLDGYKLVFRMIESASDHSLEDVTRMSDEELETELMGLLKPLMLKIHQEPEHGNVAESA